MTAKEHSNTSVACSDRFVFSCKVHGLVQHDIIETLAEPDASNIR